MTIESQTEIRLGESTHVVAPVHNEIAGGYAQVTLPSAIGLAIGVGIAILVGIILWSLFAARAPSVALEWIIFCLAAMALLGALLGVRGWEAGRRIGSAKHFDGYIAGLRARGTPAQLVTRFRITDEALEILSDRLSFHARWGSILQLFGQEEYWLIQSDTITFILPRRAFADSREESTFVRSIADRMPVEAQLRSRDALAVLAAV